MASVEVQVATAPAGSIPTEEKVEDIEEAVKNIEIEPTTEKVAEEEAPPSSPAEEDPVAVKRVDESPDKVEKSAEESTGTLTASEPGVESAQLEPEETPEPKEEAVEPPKVESVAQAPAEVAAVEENANRHPVRKKLLLLLKLQQKKSLKNHWPMEIHLLKFQKRKLYQLKGALLKQSRL